MNTLISKARKPQFELHLRIHDLNNVPLVSGTSFVKWHLPSSTAAQHRGRTDRAPIKEHKVTWDYSRSIPIRLIIDKKNILQECWINFEVIQDYSSAGRPDKITLGKVDLNLAEYVEEGDIGPHGDESVVRRYLMQESKINSTLKIGIGMKQVDGERNFVAPPLKTAMVFGGITGIMAGEQDIQDDVGRLPQISKSRDNAELQDMYRQALAASWASPDGELTADQCIDDIFNGGDGWKHENQSTYRGMQEENSSDDNQHHMRSQSGMSLKSQVTATARISHSSLHQHSGSRESLTAISGVHRAPSSEGLERGQEEYKNLHEIDEFEIREDLVAWKLPRNMHSSI